MLTCRELIDRIREQLDGELTAEMQAAVDEHLAVCPPCVEYLRNYRQTVALSQIALRAEEQAAGLAQEVPEQVARSILDKLREMRRQR